MTDEERVCEILAACRERAERGDAVDFDAVVEEHPNLAALLRERFDALAALERAYPAAPASPSARPASGDDWVGKRIGAYRLLEAIGSGGMGSVWRAVVEEAVQGIEVGRAVALKVPHPHLLRGRDVLERFLREAELGRAVVHPNVVRTLHADEARVDGREHHFLVTEWIEGQTLGELLCEMERVPEELCRHIGREASRGLAAIHAAGIVHRDVKPANLLISKDHVVKVMDLGVARFTGEAVRLSQTGAFIGSIQYAAPEQLERDRKNVDARADLHGLGLVLYELACGVHPYLADDLPRIVQRVLHERPRRLGDVDPQISPFFEEVVHCLLEKDREQRFASARELADVLDAGEGHAWWKERARALRLATRRPLRRIRIPRETAVYGREAEIARLRGLFERAKAGEGQVVLLEGEAGIGKSRLVDELVARLQENGEDLSFLHGSYAPGGAATASGAFSTAYREQLGEVGSAPYLTRTPLLVPAFDALLDGDATPAGAEPLTRGSIQSCFVHVTRALGAERVTVVLIEALQFAPEDGRALFTSLALAVPGHRVLLVGTTRPGLPETWRSSVTRLEHCTPVALARLGPKDLVRLLEDAFRSRALASSLSAQIALKSDGNPFFAFEIVRGLREGQLIVQREDGSWVTTGAIGEIKIPSSVLDLVNARVAGLTQAERDVVDVACCLGFEFDPLLVGDVVGMRRVPLLKLLSQLERKHRIVRSAGPRFVFDHHQVQEALYQGLPELLRQEYHRALASAIETRDQAAEADPATLEGEICVALCEHFLRGADGARALRYLDAAMTHLEASHQNTAAEGLAERALAVSGLVAGVDRAPLLLRLADLLDLSGRRERQLEAGLEAEGIGRNLGDGRIAGWAALKVGLALTAVSKHRTATEPLIRGQEIARRLGDKELEAAVARAQGGSLWAQGRLSEARGRHELALSLSRKIGDRSGEAGATVNLGLVLYAEGRLPEARACHERGAALAHEAGHRRFESNALTNLGNVLLSLGRLAEARRSLEQSLAIARAMGNRSGETFAVGSIGNVFFVEGRMSEARDHYESKRILAREMGDAMGEANAVGCLGGVAFTLGRLAEAQAYRERELALYRIGGHRLHEFTPLQWLADIATERGEIAEAERLRSEAIAICREMGAGGGLAETLHSRGEMLATLGRADEARAALGEARVIAERLPLPHVELLASASLARLAEGDATAARTILARLEDRVPLLSAMSARFLLWLATHDLEHLVEAKRRLDHLVEHAPADCRESMLSNVRVHREIAAAAREAGL